MHPAADGCLIILILFPLISQSETSTSCFVFLFVLSLGLFSCLSPTNSIQSINYSLLLWCSDLFEKGKEMATTTASTADFSDKSSSTSTITTTAGNMLTNNKDLEFQVSSRDRDEIHSALAKAVELRALHSAAKLNSNRYPPSPVSVSVSKSAHKEDYPVFTPVSFHYPDCVLSFWVKEFRLG